MFMINEYVLLKQTHGNISEVNFSNCTHDTLSFKGIIYIMCTA